MPTTLMLELTNKCNLHCVTCPREYGYGKEMAIGEMPTAMAKAIVDEALPYLMSIGLTGMGETLFAPNLVEVARYIKRKRPGVVTFISTNANMPDFIERISAALPYIDTVQISTDGVGQGYEAIRRGGSFGLLRDNIAALKRLPGSAKVDVMFNMVINRRNFKEMPRVIELADEMGVRFVNFTYINLASLTSIPVSYYDFFATDEYLDVLNATRATAAAHKSVEVTGLDFPGSPGIRKCPLMWNHFQINHDGEVPPCCGKPFAKEYSFGNVAADGQSVRTVINSERAKAFRRQWVEGKPDSFCAKCHFVHL
jgi:radical SAM protein with 4Fe4S-binding SPASM domain